jgi:hypothetical protein
MGTKHEGNGLITFRFPVKVFNQYYTGPKVHHLQPELVAAHFDWHEPDWVTARIYMRRSGNRAQDYARCPELSLLTHLYYKETSLRGLLRRHQAEKKRFRRRYNIQEEPVRYAPRGEEYAFSQYDDWPSYKAPCHYGNSRGSSSTAAHTTYDYSADLFPTAHCDRDLDAPWAVNQVSADSAELLPFQAQAFTPLRARSEEQELPGQLDPQYGQLRDQRSRSPGSAYSPAAAVDGTHGKTATITQ